MRKTLLTLFAALLTAGHVSEQSSKLSPYTRIYLQQHKTEVQQQRAKAASGKSAGAGSVRDSIDTFLKLNDGSDVSEIEGVGVRVVNRFGQLLTVRMALGDVERVATLPSVKNIDIGAPIRFYNDSARIASNVNILHSGGGGLGQQYTGKGVIVGMIDGGIEYNHINFKDANGKSRVKMVYDIVNNKTYLDPDEIATLTTDDVKGTHGSHTTGTAAGSYAKNGYQGMAPDADLILCGAGHLPVEATVVNAAKKIFDYADLVNKPAVINMSLGDIIGPHDGSENFIKSLNALKAPGHIISMSSGNDGGEALYIKHHSENADDSLQFNCLLMPSLISSGNIDLWSKSPNLFQIPIGLQNLKTMQIEGTMPMIPDSVIDSYGNYSYVDSLFLKDKCNGTFSLSGSLDANNNRYHVQLSMSVDFFQALTTASISVLMVYSKKNETIEGWSNNGFTFIGTKIPDSIDGSDSCTVNSLAYGTNTICVGAYVTKQFYYNQVLKKNQTYVDAGDRGDIASFSGYGMKDDGTVLPDIIAPGTTLISSFNKYARAQNTSYICDSLIADDGHVDYWGAMSGTSMSTPVVTGIIATWLQYKPTLTVEEIKDIFDNTAISDYYVKKYHNVKSGRGKIDAYGGLKYQFTTNIGNPECAQHQLLIYPSADGKVNIYAQGETGNIHVGVYAASGMTVLNRTIATTDGSATLDLGNMPKGLYIIKVEGVKARGSNTLTVR